MKGPPEDGPTPSTPTHYSWLTRKPGSVTYLAITTPSTPYQSTPYCLFIKYRQLFETRPTPSTAAFYSCFTRKYGRFVFLRRTTPSILYRVILHDVLPWMGPLENSATPSIPMFAMKGPPEDGPTPSTPTHYLWMTRKPGLGTPSTPYRFTPYWFFIKYRQLSGNSPTPSTAAILETR